MYKIGIGGSKTSGRNIITRILADLANIPTIGSDKLVREIVVAGRSAFSQIVEVFGKDVLTSHGLLDRAKVNKLVGEGERDKLNAILFPVIKEEVERTFDNLSYTGNAFAVFDSPSLFDGFEELVDMSVYVYLSRYLLIEQHAKAKGIPQEEAMEELRSYIEAEQAIIEKADVAIMVDGSFGKMRDDVVELWRTILVRAGKLDE